MFGAEALGAYAVAYTIAYTPVYTVVIRTSTVVLASISQFADDQERRQDAILRSLSAILMLLGPVVMMIMLCGPRVVALLFPKQWTETV